MKNEIVSSSKHEVRSLWALLTPNQPQHAIAQITITQFVVKYWISTVDQVTHFWIGWLSRFLNAVNPSKLPFTPQYFSLHAHLVDLLDDIIDLIQKCENVFSFLKPTINRKTLKKCCLSFLNLSKEFLIHLSHNIFADHPDDGYTINYFLSKVMRFDLKTPTTTAFRQNLKQEMISSALASSSPPFILTAELVCPLTDSETIDVVNRIVCLLDSDSSLDDDTILRICVFISRHDFRNLQLAFRNTGRPKEQYLHAFVSFVSLHIESFDEAPIQSLLSPRQNDRQQPTLDEWDEVDLETVRIVMRMKEQNQLSINTESDKFEELFIKFVLHSLKQVRHCATRLTQTQLEHLITPSIDCLSTYFRQHHETLITNKQQWEEVFTNVCFLCNQPVVARAITKTGIFVRFMNDLTIGYKLSSSMRILICLFNNTMNEEVSIETRRMWRREGFPTIGEEGLEDTLEFMLSKKPNTFTPNLIKNQTQCVLIDFGANFRMMLSDDV
ncbi:hypothetical protein BLNAU_18371 [Blattamonas nauphoetae]|uniref:Uncharacterized protein n=1 Tax=Blattamonas nauphoetae TaxID=2049346 RepID=A0ABQ9X4K1_9EUKA|nr:hypothetical protein BLNAU_18371 [Blattamonas nauphoetae]